MKQFFEEKRPHNGLTYQEYAANTEKYITSTDPETLSAEKKALYEYTKLNIQRSSRVFKTFKPSEELINTVKSIDKFQLWMVITEDWCGDSSQNLPNIVMMAELNENIHLRIIERDKNLDIMDQYLTNGTARSIPKLVAFDQDGNELFQWGPRPVKAQDLVNESKAAGMTKDEFIPKLYLWYAKNRGEEISKEFIELIKNSVQ